ncbi:MAG: hypothetical protein WA908_11150, partial [Pontixanthobacter sp.]
MTRSHNVRNASALGVTALLGLGCSHSDGDRAQTGNLSFEEPGQRQNNDYRKIALPQPGFGPMAFADESIATPIAAPRKADHTTISKLRDDLLASVGRTPLLRAPDTVAPAIETPAEPTDISNFAPAPPAETAFGSQFRTITRPRETIDIATIEAPTFDLLPLDVPLPALAMPGRILPLPVADSVPREAVTQTATYVEQIGASPDRMPATAKVVVEQVDAQSRSPTIHNVAAASEPAVEWPATLPAAIEAAPPPLAVIVPPARAPIPMVTAQPVPVPVSTPIAANDVAEPAVRSGTERNLRLPETLPPVAAAAPSPEPPRTSAATFPPPSFVPAPRKRTTLGLDRPTQAARAPATTPVAGTTTALGPDRSGGFTVSDEAPTLSYQDELILEIQVTGVNASDTILAYGTRQGVYLPIGTLARILDLAITVSDDGNYAGGWVLQQARTLTIDLRRNILKVGNEESDLPLGAAVAFDGDLYLLADRIAQFLPLTVETDLRAQTVTLTTLEPFPFEERMRREADRARLANRGANAVETAFVRQDTPFLIASVPVGDVDLRAISDATFGARAELDLQFAGDLGYLTAETFLSADTRNGLTTSLIKLGRQDPDADLLGPLSATAFAVGDVATVSMPLGLRSVTGRGFAASNTPPEEFSVFERIDLRGVLPDGFEVELYRNDILVGSTRDAVNGRYEFLQIPVDFGLNVFRLVFFGPQGQRSEEVRRISVGDGRLPTGKLIYRIGAVQKDQNLLGVRPPRFIRPRDFGEWRASAEMSYGVSSDITAVVSGALFERGDRTRWL